MMRVVLYFFTGLFLLFFGTNLPAQEVLPNVQTKLNSYAQAENSEKLFLHTDKNFYTAGEIVWCKLYLVDGLSHQPLSASKVAYVEIIDKNNLPVSQAKIALREKGGNGSILLPFRLRSGYYIIRAYTNWMKNSGAGNFFEKQITIVNPLISPEAGEEKEPPAYRLQLFPEGGDLVNDLSSKMAFHLTDAFGKGVHGQGYLLNSNNDTLASFVPFKFGMGHFTVTPQNGTVYRVVFTLDDGNTVSQLMPQSMESGYVLQLEEANDKIRITVKTNVHAADPGISLLVHARKRVRAAQKNYIADGTAVFTVDKSLLDEGVNVFTIFDHTDRPVCERLFFVQPGSQRSVALQASKEEFTTREKVDFSITPISGQENMSLSVYQLDDLETGESTTIDQYLWLTSELNGPIEQPGFYFSAWNDEVLRTADYLMMTNGWRRFKWDDVLDQSPVVKFPREQFGQIITGRVTDTRTNARAKGIQVFLSIPNSPQKLFTSVSDSNGLVQFEVPDYYGQGEMTVQTDFRNDSFYRVEVLTPFAEGSVLRKLPSFSLSKTQLNDLLNRSIGMQAQHIYVSDSIERFYRPLLTDTFPFYGMPMHSYKLDDYRRFTTMEEVLREYVREINVGVKGSGVSLRFKLFNEVSREFLTDNILVMVDGIPLSNPNKVFDMDPLKIRQLDIINRNYVLGNRIFSGLANFSSYHNSYEGLELNPGAVTIDYEGLQLRREFYSPDYSTEAQHSSRLPDLRSTLLWMPDVREGKGSFHTGDNKGRFLMVLQGIDDKGQTIYASSQIEVK